MVTLADVWTVAPTLGVIVALYYYAATLRNIEKSRKEELISQRLQVASIDYYRILQDVRLMVDWGNVDEFRAKYHYTINREAYSKMEYLLNLYNGIGLLFEDGLVSIDWVLHLYPPYTTIGIWEQFKPYIEQARETMKDPNWLKPYERLYIKARKMYPNTSSMSQNTLSYLKKHD
jgi:hypothetical protein